MKTSKVNQKIQHIVREDIDLDLHEKNVKPDPFEQFIDWFDQALQSEPFDPSAMVLATVDEKGWPDTRVVLLKELTESCLIFFTNYMSSKAQQLMRTKMAAINFYWPHEARQVRIRGTVERVSRDKSEKYFATRPREAQIGAHASLQSSIIVNREEIDNKVKLITEKFSNQPIPCPENWGGYQLTPLEYEFFQGKKWRVHDRLLYTLVENKWKIVRLSP